jgi:hypothetical protein
MIPRPNSSCLPLIEFRFLQSFQLYYQHGKTCLNILRVKYLEHRIGKYRRHLP